jgi:hypothetical protein
VRPLSEFGAGAQLQDEGVFEAVHGAWIDDGLVILTGRSAWAAGSAMSSAALAGPLARIAGQPQSVFVRRCMGQRSGSGRLESGEGFFLGLANAAGQRGGQMMA